MMLEICNDIIKSMPSPGLVTLLVILTFVTRGDACFPGFDLDLKLGTKEKGNSQTNHAFEGKLLLLFI